MKFSPYIENRKEYYRKCKCGKDHENKYIRGLFKYGADNEAIFCAALLEHKENKHIWISFIGGNWPGTEHEDCAVTSSIYTNEKGRVFSIQNGEDSPFIAEDIFDCYQVTREQVLSTEGAKDWFINTYLLLFEADSKIGNYLENNNA